MARWAPLVYARTLKVDFRLLAIPGEADAADLEWLRECVEGSTVYPDELRENSRVSLFRNDRLCAFGVTCMAGLLSGRNTKVGSRELYLFSGYVTPAPNRFSVADSCAAIPSLAGLRRGAFRAMRPLYSHVNRFWRDERLTLTENETSEIRYAWQDVPELQRLTIDHHIDPRTLPDAPLLNRSRDRVRLIPDADANVAWSESVLTGGAVSLCIGLPNATAALRSPFLNAGVLSLKETRDESRRDVSNRQDQEPSTPKPPPPAPPTPPEREEPGGFSRMVGSLFRRPTPLEPLPDDLSDPGESDESAPFTRPWDEDQDSDSWIND